MVKYDILAVKRKTAAKSLSQKEPDSIYKNSHFNINAVNQSVTSTELDSVFVGKLKPQTKKVLVRFISFSTNVCFNHSHTKYVKK